MIPPGKTCLCCEDHVFGNDDLAELDDDTLTQLALSECASSKLVDPQKCFDRMVIRLPGADASQNRHNWYSADRQAMFAALAGAYRNLYVVGRTDVDISTLAGLEAADAIVADDCRTFDWHSSPSGLGIRSEAKPFEFRAPLGVEI